MICFTGAHPLFLSSLAKASSPGKCDIFPLSFLSKPDGALIDVLKINSNSTIQPASLLPIGKHSTSGWEQRSDTIRSETEAYPTSIINAASSKGQNYSLETGKTTGYFSHKIRDRKERQLVVTARDPDVLLKVLKRGPGVFVQTERSYWYTYTRIVLHFTDGFDEEAR